MTSRLYILLIAAAAFFSGVRASSQTRGETILSISDFDSISARKVLVLSGGGARGISQIGALKAFDSAGVEFDYIVGTSVGAIVGGLFASGYSPGEIDSIVCSEDWEEIFALNSRQNRSAYFIDQKQIHDRSLFALHFDNFKLKPPKAVSTGASLNRFLQKLLWRSVYNETNDFDKLKYKFRAVATDLNRGEPKALCKGSIVAAIRASAAVPMQYSPVRMDSLALVDGGLLANIPVRLAKKLNPDFIFSINTTSPLHEATRLDDPLTIADQIVSIMMREFNRTDISQSDMNLTPDLKRITNADFDKCDSLIKIGEKAALGIMDNLRRKLDSADEAKLDRILHSAAKINNGKAVELFGFSAKDSAIIEKKSGAIEKIKAAFKAGKSGFYENIEIKSGENYSIYAHKAPIINNLRIVDSAQILSKKFKSALDSAYSGAPLNKKTKREIAEKVLKIHRRAGYTFAAIIDYKFEENAGELIATVDEGLYAGAILAEGCAVNPALIRREIHLKKGAPLSANELAKTWDNLVSTDLFSYVEIIPKRVEGKPGVYVAVRVEEIGSQTLRFGGRIDSERNTQGNIEFIEENLLNFGSRASFRVAGGSRNQKVVATLEQPRFFNTMLTFNISGYYDSRKVYQYENVENLPPDRFERRRSGENIEKRYGAKAWFGGKIERKGLAKVEIRHEKQRSYKVHIDEKPPYYEVSSIKFQAIFDTENRAYFPTEGRTIDISLESSLFNTKESRGFSKAVFRNKSYYSFGRHSIITSSYFGFADKTLPSPEFFSLGGEDRFFGLREEEERGRQIALANLEYRFFAPFRIFFDSYFSLRYDIGSVWEETEKIRIASMKHGVGAKVSLDTPIGPASVSVGRSFFFVANPDGAKWGPLMFYFSAGLKL